jgi:hypothetical protein
MARSDELNPNVNLQVQLQDIPDEFLKCRDMRHWWKETRSLHITESSPEGDVVERHSECKRECGTSKSEIYLLRVDRWGVQRLEFVRTSYDYPEGYLMPAMVQADHAREILRFESMRRSLATAKATRRKKT